MAARIEGSTLNDLGFKFLDEEHRCFLCKGYLSCGPVRLLLPGGKSICGRCPTSDSHSEYLASNAGSIHAKLPLENILRNVSFPCRFRESGCTECILFGQVEDHASRCAYKTVACPALPFGSCRWNGLLSLLLGHFLTYHLDYVKTDDKFILQLGHNSNGNLMTIKNNVLFIVKYFFNANILKYDIRYCTQESECEITSKIKLINHSDTECTVGLNSTKCVPYDSTFNMVQNVMVLDLKKYVPVLNDPSSIIINLKLKVTSEKLFLNLYFVEYLKCQACKKYLLPPLFDLDHNTVCYNCGTNNSKCVPSKDTKIIKFVSETNFPCEWDLCKFMGKGQALKDHNPTCQFREIECPACGITYILLHNSPRCPKCNFYAPIMTRQSVDPRNMTQGAIMGRPPLPGSNQVRITY